jgi:dTDP-4-dehydrorhamnose reductase
VKVFISGADGALGTEVQRILTREKASFLATDIKQLDFTDFKKVNESVLKYRPDVILHFGALSDVDECERDKDAALRVNGLGTLGFAVIARKIGAKILYTSTNFVFEGNTETPYFEDDLPAPVNVYGRTKLLGEQYIKDHCDRYYIVRTSWLFGNRSKTFVSKFLQAREKPRSVNVVCDLIGSFTYVPDLAEMIFQLVKSENYGTYHIINSGIGSWLDFAIKARHLMKFNTEIMPVKAEELNLPARRPQFAALGSRNYEFLFDRKMRKWEDALADFIRVLDIH